MVILLHLNFYVKVNALLICALCELGLSIKNLKRHSVCRQIANTSFITGSVRSTWEGNILTPICLSVHKTGAGGGREGVGWGAGGMYPYPAPSCCDGGEGYPHPVLMAGYSQPVPKGRGTPCSPDRGYPSNPNGGGGTPIQS